METIKDILKFIRQRKKYWLIPVILFLFLLGFLLVVLNESALSSLLYTLF